MKPRVTSMMFFNNLKKMISHGVESEFYRTGSLEIYLNTFIHFYTFTAAQAATRTTIPWFGFLYFTIHTQNRMIFPVNHLVFTFTQS